MYGKEFDTGSFELLPAGEYEAKIDNLTLEASKNDPTKMYLSIKHKVQTGPHKNRVLFQNITLPQPGTMSEGHAKFLSWQLGVLGAWSSLTDDMDYDTLTQTVAEKAFEMVGKTFILEVSKSTYNGKERNDTVIKKATVINYANDIAEPKFDTNDDFGF